MSIVERVEALLRNYEGAPCCDDHVTKRLGLARKQAQQAIYSLVAKSKDCRRNKGLCVQCAYDDCQTKDQDKKVTYISK